MTTRNCLPLLNQLSSIEKDIEKMESIAKEFTSEFERQLVLKKMFAKHVLEIKKSME